MKAGSSRVGRGERITLEDHGDQRAMHHQETDRRGKADEEGKADATLQGRIETFAVIPFPRELRKDRGRDRDAEHPQRKFIESRRVTQSRHRTLFQRVRDIGKRHRRTDERGPARDESIQQGVQLKNTKSERHRQSGTDDL